MIKERVAEGSFNLNEFIEIMQGDGCITEINTPEGVGLPSPYMERTSTLQEEFNELFKFFYPRQLNDIEFECVATNKGFKVPAGAYSYALFNKNVITREQVQEILIKENQLNGN